METRALASTLAWNSRLHTLSVVWQALWFAAERGEDPNLASALGLDTKTYLSHLGTLVRLELIRVSRVASGIQAILVRREVDQGAYERVLKYRTTGDLPETKRVLGTMDPGVYFVNEDWSLYNNILSNILDNTKYAPKEHTKQDTNNTLERGVGKTFSDFDVDLDPFAEVVAAKVVTALTPYLPKKRETKSRKPSEAELTTLYTLFHEWLQIMGYQDRNLTIGEGRTKFGLARLRAGHPPEEFLEIMRWCAGNAHMRGQNDGGRAYDDWDTLFASEGKFTKYLKLARTQKGKPAQRKSEDLAATDKPTTYRTM